MLRALGRTAMAATIAALGFTAAPVHAQQPAPPPATPDPLAAARALFSDALADEEAGRLADALDKFRRVREVRDTAAVEYRIATCQEGLGDLAGAFTSYRSARRLAGDDPQGADLTRAASDRLLALGARIALLTLVLPQGAPPEAEVQVDDRPVTRAALAEAIPLVAGHHVVRAASPGATIFRTEIVLAEGAQVSIAIPLEGSPQAPAPAPAPAPALAPIPAPSQRTPLAGWLTIGGGALLLSGAAVLLVLRHDDIAHLNQSCPGGRCPPGADAPELESTRNRALVEGPVALGCGIAGVVAAGVGAYLVLASRASATAWSPFVTSGGGGVAIAGVLP